MIQRIKMTPTGYQKVLADLNDLLHIQRPQVVRDLEEARAHGDLSENAEYEEAKERQGQIESRIYELEQRISGAEVVDLTRVTETDRVDFGATVELQDEDTGRTHTYRLVGAEEVDARAGLISYDSPIGRALTGREEGDEVRVEIPSGARTFLITAIRYV